MEHTVHTEQASSEPVWLRTEAWGSHQRYKQRNEWHGCSRAQQEVRCGHQATSSSEAQGQQMIQPHLETREDTYPSSASHGDGQLQIQGHGYKFDLYFCSTRSRWPHQLARLSQATWWTSNSMFWTPVKLTQSQVSRQSEGETYFYKGSNYLNLISAGVLFFLNQYWIIVDGIYNIFNLSFSC